MIRLYTRRAPHRSCPSLLSKEVKDASNLSVVMFVIVGAIFVGLTMAIGPFGSSTGPGVDDDELGDRNNWQIKIDEATYNSEDYAIGDRITSFEKQSFTIQADGEDRSLSLCPNLPKIQMTNDIAAAVNRFAEITLEYDPTDCSISVHDQTTAANPLLFSPNVARASYDEIAYGRGLAEIKALDGNC